MQVFDVLTDFKGQPTHIVNLLKGRFGAFTVPEPCARGYTKNLGNLLGNFSMVLTRLSNTSGLFGRFFTKNLDQSGKSRSLGILCKVFLNLLSDRRLLGIICSSTLQVEKSFSISFSIEEDRNLPYGRPRFPLEIDRMGQGICSR